MFATLLKPKKSTTIRDNIVGQDILINGPFGTRKMMYADYVASGRAYAPIETALQKHIMPLYANTHTEASRTGRQTTAFREQSRKIIATAIGATQDDAVIFCGTGCTGAIDKFINILGLKVTKGAERHNIDFSVNAKDRPIVFIGPFEHHSNDVQWRETIAEVITIKECPDGGLDLKDLEAQLIKYKDRPLKIGSFSAASNVTGIICDTAPVAKILHKYGALAAFDCAASAPYLPINMNEGGDAYMDAVFISTHKLLGGPGTPGILAFKKKWAQNKTPVIPGGGTVSYVSPCAQAYLECVEHREEGGTPDIVGAIRAGLSFDLRNQTGIEGIKDKEIKLAQRAITRWGKNKNIKILGSNTAERLPFFSFLIHSGEQYLHYNFVVALLNDMFGIQARGGCSCAGPYGHRLLDINLDVSREYEKIIADGVEILKPGWIRVGFNYFYNEEDCELLMRAIEWVADHGAKLLPYYTYETQTGQWVHVDAKDDLLDLTALESLKTGRAPHSIDALFAQADAFAISASKLTPQKCCDILNATPKHLHWFAHA
ncbi:MAG: aminotransferase [Robiginitomaculum sp.]|nr:MAG: aminotransferase [Robiginitomaculum sp.]